MFKSDWERKPMFCPY
ncbi:rCG31921 [Rattus norvegicus]|uniref:RCG31921 n=1 Tax=Rattus norvegicus TaxID=10116 RepID=A6MGW5_RAT|nr:rCG31921 [Rattus norvegicus]